MDTLKYTLKPKIRTLVIAWLVLVWVWVSCASMFFTKKFFLKDFNMMNNEYKQLLFNSWKEKREDTIQDYEKLISIYDEFQKKYTSYKPFDIKLDKDFDQDLSNISDTLNGIKNWVYSWNLPKVHITLEWVRTVFQNILKRNWFSLLTVALVDFHDTMEVLISAADQKNAQEVMNVYSTANEKLMEVENNYLNDDWIKQIRSDLDALLQYAKDSSTSNDVDQMPSLAQNLKASFIKVYLAN